MRNNIKTILKSLRKFNRMTQEELSSKLGISRSYLCEIEKGKKNPTLELIYKYSEVFDIEPCLILQFSNDKNKLIKKFNKFVVRFLEYIMKN
jgi:transcriptional regulator with XRE-family HTH domain